TCNKTSQFTVSHTRNNGIFHPVKHQPAVEAEHIPHEFFHSVGLGIISCNFSAVGIHEIASSVTAVIVFLSYVELIISFRRSRNDNSGNFPTRCAFHKWYKLFHRYAAIPGNRACFVKMRSRPFGKLCIIYVKGACKTNYNQYQSTNKATVQVNLIKNFSDILPGKQVHLCFLTNKFILHILEKFSKSGNSEFPDCVTPAYHK